MEEDSVPEINNFSSIPVIKEEVEVEKKVIEKARVQLSKTVDEETETLNLPVMNEEVRIERIPINKIMDKAPEPVRYEDETMIIPVLREVAVIEKKILLVEEIRVIKTKIHSETTQEISLRKENIKIERFEK